MPRRLAESEIETALGGLPGWAREGDEITRTFTFPNFREAVAFVNRVAEIAEADNHHPDIDVRWNKVTLCLSTHSAGGLTGADFDLANRVSL